MECETATPAAIPRLESIAEAAFAPYVARIGRRPAPMQEDFRARVAEGRVTLLIVDGMVAGYAVTRVDGAALQIDTIALDPAYHGRGLGRGFLASVEGRAQADGLTRIALYTNAAMHGNLTFYPRLGYAETGRRAEAGFDRVYFEKDLADAWG